MTRVETKRDFQRLAVALIMLLALLVALILVRREQPAAQVETLRIVGQEEIVFDWRRDACTERHIPDAPARAFRDAQGRIQLIIARQTNYRLIGPDFEQLSPDCTPILSSDSEPHPERFNDREWIRAVYTPDGRTVYALLHNEYQGHRYSNRCPSGDYQRCWYNAVTLAISQDMGDSYTHEPPPQHLIAALPYPYEPDAGPAGVFAPSNIMRNPKDGYYYAFVRIPRHYGEQPSGACLMRTDELSDPDSWRAWGGEAFDVVFANPYNFAQDRPDTAAPEQHLCQPVAPVQIQLMSDSLTYNTRLDRFVLIGAVSKQQPGSEGRSIVTGIYYSLSADLIHWTPRALLLEAELPWSYSRAGGDCGEPPINYPALIDPDSPSRNFDTTDGSAHLYFSRFHLDSNCRLSGADLVRVPVIFGHAASD